VRSVDVLDALVRDVPGPSEYRHQCAYSHLQLGRLVGLHQSDEAEKHFRVAIALYEGLLSEQPDRLSYNSEVCEGYYQLIEATTPAPEAQALYRKMVACAEVACQPFFEPNRLTTRPADQARREMRALDGIASCLVDPPASVGRDHQLLVRIGRAMTELDPRSSGGWVKLAKGLYLAGDWTAAEAAFGRAAELKHKLSVADQMYFSMTLWRQGNQQEALRNYQSADERRGRGTVGRTQRAAAELMGITISPSSKPVE
jgi:tetratricopeptide (TPR) repeat protein